MRQVRVGFLLALGAVAAFGGYETWARLHRQARVLAFTTCPFSGPPAVTLNAGIQPWDTLPVRVHEEVHAGQCRELGPFRYRLRSLTSKLELETPAYCAAAKARLTQDPDSEYASDRLHDDMIEGLSDVTDSATVKRALMAGCPEIAAKPRRTRARVVRPTSPGRT